MGAIDEFASAIDLSQSRISSFPFRVFLCGGKISPPDSPPTGSARDAFIRFLRRTTPPFHNDVVLAEHVIEWFEDGVYGDLLTFEEHLGGLVGVTLLFVETPGSFTELGAFSKLPAVSERIIVVTDQAHAHDRSFIRLGPLKYLQGQSTEAVQFYPFPAGESDEDWDDACKILQESIQGQLGRLPASPKLRNGDCGHLMLLIVDFIETCSILRIGDIQRSLRVMGADLPENLLTQFLFVLSKVGYIEEVSYANERFYVASGPRSFVHFGFKESAKVRDRDRWKNLILDFYIGRRDKRANAFRSWLKRHR